MQNNVELWKPKVTRRNHPPGRSGTIASIEEVARRVKESFDHPYCRSWAGQKLFEAGDPKGNMKRAEALLTALRAQCVYMNDPQEVEYMAGAHLMLGDGKNPPEMRGGDCFAEGTMVLAEGPMLVPIEHVEPGMRIWGLTKWVRVEAAVSKGPLSIDVVVLNNGGQLRLTANHKVNVLVCPKHPHPQRSSDEAPCSCDVSRRTMVPMRVCELLPGMVLTRPPELPYDANDTSSLVLDDRARAVALMHCATLSRTMTPSLLRVSGVATGVAEVYCYDIQTEDHHVYLPEHDVTVRNCDDLTIAYLSACEAIGIRTAVCGAGYDKEQNISHVLGMVNDDNGNWYYADPSTSFPFGEAKIATYEDVIDVRTGKHICASSACTIPLKGQKSPPIGEGRFVGVDGLPGMVGSVGDELSSTPTTADFDSLRALSARLGTAWEGFVDAYTDMREVSTILGAPPPGDPANKVWTPEVEQRARNAQSIVGVLRMALDQAAAGARKVGYTTASNGLTDLGIERLPGDPYYVALDADMRPQVFQTSDNAPVQSSGQVAGWPLLAGAFIGSILAAWITVTYLETQPKMAGIAADEQYNKRQADMLQTGVTTPEQAIQLRLADAKIKEIQAKSAPRPVIEQVGGAAKDTADSVASIVTTVVGGAAVLAVGYFAFQAYQSRGRLWPNVTWC